MRAKAALIAAVLTAAVAVGAVGALAAGSPASTKTVTVALSEWKLTPSATRAPAGKVTFVVRNRGNIEHEFVVIRTTRHHHLLPTSGGQASEAGTIGEIEEIGPGQTKRVTLRLKAGKYVLICNLPGHYMAGQYASLQVR